MQNSGLRQSEKLAAMVNPQHSEQQPSHENHSSIVEGDVLKQGKNGEAKEKNTNTTIKKQKEGEGIVAQFGKNDVITSW